MCREHHLMLESWAEGLSRELGQGNPTIDHNIRSGIIFGEQGQQVYRFTEVRLPELAGVHIV